MRHRQEVSTPQHAPVQRRSLKTVSAPTVTNVGKVIKTVATELVSMGSFLSTNARCVSSSSAAATVAVAATTTSSSSKDEAPIVVSSDAATVASNSSDEGSAQTHHVPRATQEIPANCMVLKQDDETGKQQLMPTVFYGQLSGDEFRLECDASVGGRAPRVLGRGEYGFVFTFRRVRDGKLFAVKRLSYSMITAGDLDGGLRVGSPYLAKVFDFCRADREHCFMLVMEQAVCSGEEWKRMPVYLESDGEHSRSLESVLRFMWCVANGVSDLHRQGLYHLDIKPNNMLVMDKVRGIGKLCDMGLAMSSRMSRVSNVVYTQMQRPPELFLSQREAKGDGVNLLVYPCSEATEVFALGCSFYEIFTGHYLFASLTSRNYPEFAPHPYNAHKRQEETPEGTHARIGENIRVPEIANLVRHMVHMLPQQRPSIATVIGEMARIFSYYLPMATLDVTMPAAVTVTLATPNPAATIDHDKIFVPRVTMEWLAYACNVYRTRVETAFLAFDLWYRVYALGKDTILTSQCNVQRPILRALAGCLMIAHELCDVSPMCTIKEVTGGIVRNGDCRHGAMFVYKLLGGHLLNPDAEWVRRLPTLDEKRAAAYLDATFLADRPRPFASNSRASTSGITATATAAVGVVEEGGIQVGSRQFDHPFSSVLRCSSVWFCASNLPHTGDPVAYMEAITSLRQRVVRTKLVPTDCALTQ